MADILNENNELVGGNVSEFASGKVVSDVNSEVFTKVVVENESDKVTQTLCPEYYSEKRENVRYATRQAITYYSNTTGCERRANILLPTDYSTEKKYPVLFYLHGIFGDENSMLEEANKSEVILGNLREDGIVKDTIVVFPNMYATGNPDLQPGFDKEQIAPYDNFINDLVNDLVPFIESNYSVVGDREHRAVIGFSMGGRETLYIGLMRSDMFSSFAAIAPAPGLVPSKDMMMEHEGQYDSEEAMSLAYPDNEPELVMVCCGTNDSVVGKFPASYDKILTTNKVDHLWYEVPQADHDNNAIKSGYYNFLIRWNAIRK